MKGNERTLSLWNHVRTRLLKLKSGGDQAQFNWCLRDFGSLSALVRLGFWVRGKAPETEYFKRSNRHLVRWEYLPPAFFGGGTLTGKLWSPGDHLRIPDDIILHHANWTVGLESKIAQLQYVRSMMETRRSGRAQGVSM